MSNKRPFIIDLDPATDDLLAILIALNCKQIDIVGYTICSGRTELKQGVENLNRFLNYIGETNYSIFLGAKKPISDKIQVENIFGNDGMCGTSLNKASDSNIMPSSAHEAICEFAHKYKGKLNIICLGPLTNLANAIKHDQTIKKKFEKVYFMGMNRFGQIDNNVTEFAEFNAYYDPEAIKIVFNEFVFKNKPGFIIVDWFFAKNNDIHDKIFEELCDGDKNPKKKFYKQVYKEKNCKKQFSSPSYITANLYLMCVACYPKSIVESVEYRFEKISLKGDKRGHTIFSSLGNFDVEFINKVNEEFFINKLKESVI